MRKLFLLAVLVVVASASNAQVTSLNESFNVCDTSDLVNGAHPTGWTSWSTSGAQIWKWYSKYGITGSPCIGINGYANGTDNLNEDYLITPKLNLSAMSGTVYFSFAEKSSFYGDSLSILTSTNYSGAGDPNASGVTWTKLALVSGIFDTAKYVNYRSFTANVTSMKATPFYVAFKYTSTSFDGRLVDLDNVVTGSTPLVLGVENRNLVNPVTPVTVLGESTTSHIAIAFTAAESGSSVLSVTDLSGRKIYSKSLTTAAGDNNVEINDLNAVPGLYIVSVYSENSFGVTKTTIK